MQLGELPADASLFTTQPSRIHGGRVLDILWNGRLDLTTDDAWSLTLSEFDRFYAALIAQPTCRDDETMHALKTIRRKINNREYARRSRATHARKFLALKAENETLKLQVTLLQSDGVDIRNGE